MDEKSRQEIKSNTSRTPCSTSPTRHANCGDPIDAPPSRIKKYSGTHIFSPKPSADYVASAKKLDSNESPSVAILASESLIKGEREEVASVTENSRKRTDAQVQVGQDCKSKLKDFKPGGVQELKKPRSLTVVQKCFQKPANSPSDKFTRSSRESTRKDAKPLAKLLVKESEKKKNSTSPIDKTAKSKMMKHSSRQESRRPEWTTSFLKLRSRGDLLNDEDNAQELSMAENSYLHVGRRRSRLERARSRQDGFSTESDESLRDRPRRRPRRYSGGASRGGGTTAEYFYELIPKSAPKSTNPRHESNTTRVDYKSIEPGRKRRLSYSPPPVTLKGRRSSSPNSRRSSLESRNNERAHCSRSVIKKVPPSERTRFLVASSHIARTLNRQSRAKYDEEDLFQASYKYGSVEAGGRGRSKMPKPVENISYQQACKTFPVSSSSDEHEGYEGGGAPIRTYPSRFLRMEPRIRVSRTKCGERPTRKSKSRSCRPNKFALAEHSTPTIFFNPARARSRSTYRSPEKTYTVTNSGHIDDADGPLKTVDDSFDDLDPDAFRPPTKHRTDPSNDRTTKRRGKEDSLAPLPRPPARSAVEFENAPQEPTHVTLDRGRDDRVPKEPKHKSRPERKTILDGKDQEKICQPEEENVPSEGNWIVKPKPPPVLSPVSSKPAVIEIAKDKVKDRRDTREKRPTKPVENAKGDRATTPKQSGARTKSDSALLETIMKRLDGDVLLKEEPEKPKTATAVLPKNKVETLVFPSLVSRNERKEPVLRRTSSTTTNKSASALDPRFTSKNRPTPGRSPVPASRGGSWSAQESKEPESRRKSSITSYKSTSASDARFPIMRRPTPGRSPPPGCSSSFSAAPVYNPRDTRLRSSSVSPRKSVFTASRISFRGRNPPYAKKLSTSPSRAINWVGKNFAGKRALAESKSGSRLRVRSSKLVLETHTQTNKSPTIDKSTEMDVEPEGGRKNRVNKAVQPFPMEMTAVSKTGQRTGRFNFPSKPRVSSAVSRRAETTEERMPRECAERKERIRRRSLSFEARRDRSGEDIRRTLRVTDVRKTSRSSSPRKDGPPSQRSRSPLRTPSKKLQSDGVKLRGFQRDRAVTANLAPSRQSNEASAERMRDEERILEQKRTTAYPDKRYWQDHTSERRSPPPSPYDWKSEAQAPQNVRSERENPRPRSRPDSPRPPEKKVMVMGEKNRGPPYFEEEEEPPKLTRTSKEVTQKRSARMSVPLSTSSSNRLPPGNKSSLSEEIVDGQQLQPERPRLRYLSRGAPSEEHSTAGQKPESSRSKPPSREGSPTNLKSSKQQSPNEPNAQGKRHSDGKERKPNVAFNVPGDAWRDADCRYNRRSDNERHQLVKPREVTETEMKTLKNPQPGKSQDELAEWKGYLLTRKHVDGERTPRREDDAHQYASRELDDSVSIWDEKKSRPSSGFGPSQPIPRRSKINSVGTMKPQSADFEEPIRRPSRVKSSDGGSAWKTVDDRSKKGRERDMKPEEFTERPKEKFVKRTWSRNEWKKNVEEVRRLIKEQGRHSKRDAGCNVGENEKECCKAKNPTSKENETRELGEQQKRKRLNRKMDSTKKAKRFGIVTDSEDESSPSKDSVETTMEELRKLAKWNPGDEAPSVMQVVPEPRCRPCAERKSSDGKLQRNKKTSGNFKELSEKTVIENLLGINVAFNLDKAKENDDDWRPELQKPLHQDPHLCSQMSIDQMLQKGILLTGSSSITETQSTIEEKILRKNLEKLQDGAREPRNREQFILENGVLLQLKLEKLREQQQMESLEKLKKLTFEEALIQAELNRREKMRALAAGKERSDRTALSRKISPPFPGFLAKHEKPVIEERVPRREDDTHQCASRKADDSLSNVWDQNKNHASSEFGSSQPIPSLSEIDVFSKRAIDDLLKAGMKGDKRSIDEVLKQEVKSQHCVRLSDKLEKKNAVDPVDAISREVKVESKRSLNEELKVFMKPSLGKISEGESVQYVGASNPSKTVKRKCENAVPKVSKAQPLGAKTSMFSTKVNAPKEKTAEGKTKPVTASVRPSTSHRPQKVPNPKDHINLPKPKSEETVTLDSLFSEILPMRLDRLRTKSENFVSKLKKVKQPSAGNRKASGRVSV